MCGQPRWIVRTRMTQCMRIITKKIILCAAVVAFVLFAANRSRRNVLFPLVKQGDVAAVARVASPANVNARDKWGWTPLMHAAAAGNEDLCRALLAAGADAAARDKKQFSALEYVSGTLATAANAGTDEEYMRKHGIPMPGTQLRLGDEKRDGLIRVKRLLKSSLVLSR